MSDQDTNQQSTQPPTSIALDNPVFDEKDDKLGRMKPAQSFASSILSFDASQGIVAGVLGPWGSGKTTFINFARSKFKEEDIVVLDFNPWMFSGTEQLVQSFFSELSAQLNIRSNISHLSKYLKNYGEMLINGIAAYPPASWLLLFKKAPGKIGEWIENKYGGMNKRREKVEQVLKKQEKPIVVVLDDIDRLTTDEIRDVFKLVRLTANFPNIIYILAFDRERIETALSEQNMSGRVYLEKILQFSVDLPTAPNSSINAQLFEALDKVLDGADVTEKFYERWPDIFAEILQPLIKNMRDVRRYSAALSSSLKDIERQVTIVDVLALEAIRLFLPDVFPQLHLSIAALTTTSDQGARNNPQFKRQIEKLLEAAKERNEIIKSLIERCFPAAMQHIGNTHYGYDSKRNWLRERRIAHEDVLAFYLERFLGEGLIAFNYAEAAFELMHDADAFDSYLRHISEDRIEDVIKTLNVYENNYLPEHVVPSTTVLLNFLPDMPQRPARSFYDIGNKFSVTRVTYRLLRSLSDPIQIEEASKEIYPKLETFSSKLELVMCVGHHESVGHKLISEEAASRLEDMFCSEVCASINNFNTKREHDLLRVFLWVKELDGESGMSIELPENPDLTLALLRSSQSEGKTQSVGTRSFTRTQHLAWDGLVKIFGNEEILRARIEALKELNLDEVSELLDLAGKYLSGWRPGRWGRGDD